MENNMMKTGVLCFVFVDISETRRLGGSRSGNSPRPDQYFCAL
jgi:hypothetical protein